MLEHYSTCKVVTQQLTTTDGKHFYIAVKVFDDESEPSSVSITRNGNTDALATVTGWRGDDVMEFIGENADTLTSEQLLEFLKTYT